MAPVVTLYRLVFGGRLFDKESWSCSMNIGSDQGLNLAASTFSTPIVAWCQRPSSKMSSSARLDFIKFNRINPLTARYTDFDSNELLQNDLATGGSQPGPGQNTLAVSLRTAKARGRGHAGRFYPPTGAWAMDPLTGLVDGAAVAAALTSAVSLLRDINTAVGVGSRVVVFSKIGQSVDTVNSIRVGKVLDTMRSRRRQLGEDWVGAAL